MPTQLPSTLLHSLKAVKEFEERAFVNAHTTATQVTSIRFNPGKPIDVNRVFELQEQIPWSSHGYYLKDRPSFTLDPYFHAGAYYVQEASSMFLEEVLRQTCDLEKDIKVLDLCAAPGGKSTLIQSLITSNSFLVSNEVIKTRVNILTENITKWGAGNVVVTNNDPSNFQKLPHFFDVIIVDAPCSGSGLFRKDPAAIEEWSEDAVRLCSQRQQRILSDVTKALKPGGVLIYSTCSYSKEENEGIGDWLLSTSSFQTIKINLSWKGIVETQSDKKGAFGYRFYPHLIKGEGFFISAFRKTDWTNEDKVLKNNNKQELVPKSFLPVLAQWIHPPVGIHFVQWQGQVILLPDSLFQHLSILQSALYIKKAGVNIGAMIRNELIPSHDLAMSGCVADSVNQIELNREDALQYLRRESFDLVDVNKGWVLTCYQKVPLGFIKVMSNRMNNYYPSEWRIFNK